MRLMNRVVKTGAAFVVATLSSLSSFPQSSAPDKPANAQVLISISDKKGNAVAVSKESVSVFVRGQPAEVQSLKPAADIPLDFIVLADFSGSNRDKVEFERDAIRKLFQTLATGSNRGYFGVFNDRVSFVKRPVVAAELDPLLGTIATRGGTALYEAIVQACAYVRPPEISELRRRIIILITDGYDNASQVSRENAVRVAQRAGIPIFALQLGFPYPNNYGENALKTIAKQTGGNVLKLDRPAEFIDRLLRPLNTQYFLEFSPVGSFPGMVLTLELRATDRSVHFAAPTEYIPR
jgi:hypothetical protein